VICSAPIRMCRGKCTLLKEFW